jgi:hypothetical protein
VPRSYDGPIDVLNRVVAQAIAKGVVLPNRDIRSRFAQVLDGLVNAAAMVRALIDRRVKGEILTIVDCCLLDRANGSIDPAYCFCLVCGLLPIAGAVFDQPTCRA